MATSTTKKGRKAVIGSAANFWLHSTSQGFDLTHPPTPDAPLVYPRMPLECTTSRVTIDPAKTALIVVDMQNFFLNPALGRPRDSKGLVACEQLVKHAIPACRKAGIQIIYVNWGLTQEEIDVMPPATLRAFGFETVSEDDGDESSKEAAEDDHGINTGVTDALKKLPPKPAMGKDPRLYRGLGTEIGHLELDDGSKVDGGRLLMRDQWNAALYPTLEEIRRPEDVWIHKNRLVNYCHHINIDMLTLHRMSGLWGGGTLCTQYLESTGIRSLLFAGVNTDQCVGGSLQDAFSRGYDCLLLSDGCATTSPASSQQSIEYNAAKTYGFALTCDELEKGAGKVQQHGPDSS